MHTLSRRRFLVASAGLTATSLASCTESNAEAPPASVDIPASETVNPFAASLYGELRAKDGNIFLSPSSIHTALAMTAAGAKGTTLTQMQQVLHTAGAAKPGKAFESKSVTLAIANALWAQKGFPWSSDYKATVVNTWHASLFDADYANPEAARKTINDWVQKQTRDKIKDLMPDGSISPDTRLVLTNAIYFKGLWHEPFDKAATRNQPFTMLDGAKKEVPLMHNSDTYGYFANDDVTLVKLPYKGKEISFIGILPAKPEGFAALDKDATDANLSKWIAALHQARDVKVWLPRFKVETEYTLNEPLKKLGMTDAFSDGADFSSMAPGGDRLKVSIVVHKAFVDVNEEGTEAAAATGVAMQPEPAKSVEPKIFRADRPFLFALRHEATGTLLFLGRYTTPG